MKKIAILYDQFIPLIDVLKYKLSDCLVDCFKSIDFNKDDYDLIISAGYKGEIPFGVISSHLSLLPAFDCSEPVKEAVMFGAKVTGVTVYYTKPTKILAQYPLFIYNDAHYDEIKNELLCIEQTLLPSVVEKIIKNEPFESRTILSIPKTSCGGCNICKK